MKKYVTYLPSFEGTYGSIWSDDSDEWRQGYLDRGFELCDYENWDFDFNGYLDDLGKEYAGRYEGLVNSILGLDIEIEFNGTSSPREYNFSTDHISVTIIVKNQKKFRARIVELMKANDRKLAKIIYDNHTSRPGFWSFMSNQYDEWKRNFMQDDMILTHLIWYLLILSGELYEDNVDMTLYDMMDTREDSYWYPRTDEAKEEMERIELKEEEEERWDREHFPELPFAWA